MGYDETHDEFAARVVLSERHPIHRIAPILDNAAHVRRWECAEFERLTDEAQFQRWKSTEEKRG